jgi:hypothetical protein
MPFLVPQLLPAKAVIIAKKCTNTPEKLMQCFRRSREYAYFSNEAKRNRPVEMPYFFQT